MADYSRYRNRWNAIQDSLSPELKSDKDVQSIISRRDWLARGNEPYWPTSSLDSGNINPAYVRQAGIIPVPVGILGGGRIEETDINENVMPMQPDATINLKNEHIMQQPRVNPNVPPVNTQMSGLEKQMSSVYPMAGGNAFKQAPPPPPREEWVFDPSWQGIKNASSGLLGEAKNLFTDPRRMAMIRGGLALMDPSTYYDRQGFYSPMGGLNRAIGQASDTYQSLRKPFRDQEFKLQNTRLTNLAPTNLTKEYNFARDQGYRGSLEDYRKDKMLQETKMGKVTTGEGVFQYSPEGKRGARIGSPPPAFGYNPNDNLMTPQGEISPELSWVPRAKSSPWDGIPMRQKGPMMQADYTATNKYLEEQRVDVRTAKTATIDLQRFGFLNDQQDTGGLWDQITRFSFNEQKRAMNQIQDKLTPTMRQGLPGAASDRDVAMFANATVSVRNTREMNDAIIKGAMRLNQNKIDHYDFMVKYREVNKHLRGADYKWQQYLEDNPIFDPNAPEGSYVLNPNRQTMMEYFGGGGKPKAKSKKQPQQNRRVTDKEGWNDAKEKRFQELKKKREGR